MVVDQAFLKHNKVKSKVIDVLFDIYKAGIPKPPMGLKVDTSADEPDTYKQCLNEFYALKILITQGAEPSATAVHKLIGGKTARVFNTVRELKEEYSSEFEAKPVDSVLGPMEAAKRELIKVETAIFNSRLEEQERYAAKQLLEQEERHEAEIIRLQNMLSESTGKVAVLSDLSLDHQNTISSLQNDLKVRAVTQKEFESTLTLSDERKSRLEELAGTIKVLKDQFDHYVSEAGKRSDQLKSDKSRSESREEILKRELKQKDDFISNYMEERDGLLDKVSELSNQVEQDKLTLKHEHNQETLISTIQDIVEPFGELKHLTETWSKGMESMDTNIQPMGQTISEVSRNLIKLSNRVDTLIKTLE